MANEQEHLTPDTIDEQIEMLEGRLQFLPPDAPRTPEMQVIEALQEVYAEERRADAASLAATWNRLNTSYEATQRSQQPALSLVQMRADYERSFPMNIKKKLANWRERGFSRLALAMTIVALVSLLSGLSIGVLLVRLPHASPANVITAVPATPFPNASVTPYPTPFPSATANPQTATFFTTIQMVDPSYGWGITNTGRVEVTNSGGSAWRDVTPSGLDSPTVSAFLGIKGAWIASSVQVSASPGGGTSMLFRSFDDGQTWQQSALPFAISQMTFVNLQDGWVLVGRGVAAGSEAVDIYRTTDGGQTWNLVSSASSDNASNPNALPFGGSKTGMGFVSATTGWVTGSEPVDNFFYVYKTTDGGATWQHQDLPLPAGISGSQPAVFAPTFVNDQDGFLRVNFTLQTGTYPTLHDLYVTHNGGATWQNTNLLPATIYDFLDASVGWGTDGTNLWMTTDGAQSWTVIPQSEPFNSVQSLDFVSPTLGWALTAPSIGSLPNLLKTTNGGHTWQIVKGTLP